MSPKSEYLNLQENEPPPVPPKDGSTDTLPSQKVRRRRPPPLTEVPARDSKPLPLPPIEHEPKTKDQVVKPLPALPWKSIARIVLLWSFGMAIWFLMVALLLPVFLEGDAMPGLNRALRRWATTLWGKISSEVQS